MSKSPKPTLQEYKDAVWQYVLEHSDVNHHGALFVKFHTDGRSTFEKRIKARLRGYSRRDSRLNCSTEEKEELHQTLRTQYVTKKKAKRERWEADRAEKRRVLEAVKRHNERMHYLTRYPRPLRPLVNRWLNFYATARITVLQFKQGVSRLLRSSSDRHRES